MEEWTIIVDRNWINFIANILEALDKELTICSILIPHKVMKDKKQTEKCSIFVEHV